MTLDNAELELVTFVGTRRSQLAATNGRRRIAALGNQNGGTDTANDIRAAAAEYAVAKHTGRFWWALVDNPSKNTVRADVGKRHHVKAITSVGHSLIVKPDDPKFGTYWLCHVNLPHVAIIGAFYADDLEHMGLDTTLPYPAYRIAPNALIAVNA